MEENKFSLWIDDKIVPIANKISTQRHLKAIQNGFMSAMPMMMLGSFALILAEPPVHFEDLNSGFFYQFFKTWARFSEFAGPVLDFLFTISLGFLAVYVALGITYFLTEEYEMNQFIPMIITLGNLVLLSSAEIDGGISTSYFDGTGIFAAIFISILTTEIYRQLMIHEVGKIKLPDSVPEALSSSFESLVPAFITIVPVAILSNLLLLKFDTAFPQLIMNLISPLIKFIDNVFGVALVSAFQQILWWFGVHDSAIGAVLSPIRDANYAVNAAAYASGTLPANLPHVFTAPFWWVFVTIGGSGATLALAFLLVRSKSKQLRTLGKVAIVPSLFNINEPIIFGIPIMLNPLFLIPFVTAQTVNAILTYLAMSMNLVNKTFIEPGWNMFAPIGGLISNLDYRSVFLVLALIVIDGLIYYPFFKAHEKKCIEEEQALDAKN